MYLYGFNRNNKYEMEIFTQIVLRFASHFARCGKINIFFLRILKKKTLFKRKIVFCIFETALITTRPCES